MNFKVGDPVFWKAENTPLEQGKVTQVIGDYVVVELKDGRTYGYNWETKYIELDYQSIRDSKIEQLDI